MSDSLWPHGLQHARLHCPSPTPRAFTSTELVMPAKHFILCCHLLLLPSIFPSIRVLSMRQFFASGGQSIGASASASVLPMNIQDWFPLGLTGLISTVVQGTLKSLLQHHSSKVSILWHSAFLMVQFSHPYMTTGKTIALTRWTFLSKVMSLLCNMLSRLVITFLPRRAAAKRSYPTSEVRRGDLVQDNKVCHCFHCFPIYLPWSDGTGCHNLSFKPVFSLSSFTFI